MHLFRLTAASCNPLAKTYQNETDRTVYEYAILLQLYDCL